MKHRRYGLAPLVLLPVLLLAALAWLLATESGLRWAYGRLRAAVPGTLEVQRLDGRLLGPIEIRGLRYAAPSTDVRIDRLTLDWSPAALLAARLDIEELSANGVQLIMRAAPDTPSRTQPPSLPIDVRIRRLDIADISILRSGQTPYAAHSIELIGRISDETLEIDRLEMRTPEFELSARGALGVKEGSERLALRWRAAPPGLAAFAGHGEIAGNLSDFLVTQTLTAPVPARLRARIRNAMTAPTWDAQLDVPPAALDKVKSGWSGALGLYFSARGDRDRFEGNGKLDARYPGVPNVGGTFKLRGDSDGRLALDGLALGAAGTDGRLTANATYRLGRNAFEARLRWHDLAWPLSGEPVVTSPAGEVHVSGTRAAYRMTLAARTDGAKLPPADWRVAGTGDAAHVAFDAVAIKTLGGSVRGAARVAWSPRLGWEADMQGQDLDPGGEWREWPGSVAFAARLAGAAGELSAEIKEVRGVLRGRKLNANGRVLRRGAHYPIIALAVQSGDASVNVAGGVQAQWDIAWQVDAPDLADVLPRAAGRVRGNGRVTGARAAPTVQARLTGAGLSYDTTRLGMLDADAHVDFADRTGSRIDVRLADAMVADREIPHAALHAVGQITDHELTVETAARTVTTRMRLTGSYGDAAWRATFRDGTLRLEGDDWTLTGHPELHVGARRVSLEHACWRTAAARLCGGFSREAAGDAQLDVAADNAPLVLLAALVPQPLELRGRFSADAKAKLERGRVTSAAVRFDAGAGAAQLAASASGITLNYRRLHAQLRIDDTGLRAEAELALTGGDGGTASIHLPRFGRSAEARADQPLDGRLTLTVRDLTPFAALLPDVRDLKGSLHTDISLRGTLADPAVRGQLQLTEAGARVTASGILIRDARLLARADGRRQLQLNGFARSGDGEIGLSGRLTFEPGLAWRAELRLAGSRFQAVDLLEADVDVSPDLRLTFTPSALAVQGDVLVPRARIAPRPRAEYVVPSSDVAIVGAEDMTEPAAPLALTAKIQVTLGDNVTFDGFGLTGTVSGTLNIVDTPDQVTTARGELRIANGKYEAYGQKLDIERGRLLFVGGPISEPGIDARAVRRVEQIVAGVEVRGTLKSPELKLFSDPVMGQSDTLSYLLFGKPLESANAAQGAAMAAAARALKLSGGEYLAQRLGTRFGIEEVEIEKGRESDQAALVLGKRLSPRLYINYSIGLFESVNVFRIRYQLTAHWILQAESGLNKGGDLLYTIER